MTLPRRERYTYFNCYHTIIRTQNQTLLFNVFKLPNSLWNVHMYFSWLGSESVCVRCSSLLLSVQFQVDQLRQQVYHQLGIHGLMNPDTALHKSLPSHPLLSHEHVSHEHLSHHHLSDRSHPKVKNPPPFEAQQGDGGGRGEGRREREERRERGEREGEGVREGERERGGREGGGKE